MDGEEKIYGGCEGPDAMYVKLISSDGHEFIVKREHALTSGTIKAMLSGPGQFAENETNEVNFREIPSHVLSKVCMYFTYKGFSLQGCFLLPLRRWLLLLQLMQMSIKVLVNSCTLQGVSNLSLPALHLQKVGYVLHTVSPLVFWLLAPLRFGRIFWDTGKLQ
uniref:Elongin-C n=1 Tax=Paramormyrops kingsleyae TaxID=1676925 RepID=A0A3B3RY02_9TELE